MNFLLWLLPDTLVEFAVHAIVLIGLIGYGFSEMHQRMALKIAFIVVLSLGLYLEGNMVATREWRDKVATLEEKLKIVEEKSTQENVKIVTKYKTRTKIVEKKGKDIIQYIDKEIVKYDNSCVIPNEFVTAHNEAARGVK